MNKYITGFVSVAQGFSLIRQPGLKRYAAIPILINFCVFVFLGVLSYRYFNDWLSQLTLFERWSDLVVVQWIAGFLRFLFAAMLLLAAVFTFTLVANIIAAPFNSLLAERVEQRLCGRTLPQDAQSMLVLLRSIPKTLWSEVRKILYLLAWIIPIGILYLIPGLQVIAPFVMLLFGAWLMALEYLDYPLGNHGYGFSAVKKALKKQRMLGLGFGSAVALITAIPILNLIAMPVAVAAATSLYVVHYAVQDGN